MPIIILSATIDDDALVRCLDLGVEGLILKESASTVLTDAIRAVAAGRRWIPARLGERGLDLLSARQQGAGTLTPREQDVVAQVVAGASNRKAALAMGIAEGTVKLHLHNVFRKLAVSSRLELVVLARDSGWD